ncbi:MAG: hypothetical protein PHR16_01395 [Methylovulum sp.]|nr:hypothetical protein [Methylovulum sp.]
MSLQDRDYMKEKPSNSKSSQKENHRLNPRQKDSRKKSRRTTQSKNKKKIKQIRITASIITVSILIGGGIIIYGLLTNPEQLPPTPVEGTRTIKL